MVAPLYHCWQMQGFGQFYFSSNFSVLQGWALYLKLFHNVITVKIMVGDKMTFKNISTTDGLVITGVHGYRSRIPVSQRNDSVVLWINKNKIMQCVMWGLLLFFMLGCVWVKGVVFCFSVVLHLFFLGGALYGFAVTVLLGALFYFIFCQSQTTNLCILIITWWIHFSNKQGYRDVALQMMYISSTQPHI